MEQSARQDQDRLVFVSYASDPDKAAAIRFVTELEKSGISCWISCRDVRPGEDWPAAIIAAIRNCRIAALLMSAASNGSRHVAHEITSVVSYGKEIIPVRLEEILPAPAFELHLATQQRIDLFEPQRREGEMRRLVDELRNHPLQIIDVFVHERQLARRLVGDRARDPSDGDGGRR